MTERPDIPANMYPIEPEEDRFSEREASPAPPPSPAVTSPARRLTPASAQLQRPSLPNDSRETPKPSA